MASLTFGLLGPVLRRRALTVTASTLLACQVSFRFVPLGAAGAWQIDDVYVDPYKGS